MNKKTRKSVVPFIDSKEIVKKKKKLFLYLFAAAQQKVLNVQIRNERDLIIYFFPLKRSFGFAYCLFFFSFTLNPYWVLLTPFFCAIELIFPNEKKRNYLNCM